MAKKYKKTSRLMQRVEQRKKGIAKEIIEIINNPDNGWIE